MTTLESNDTGRLQLCTDYERPKPDALKVINVLDLTIEGDRRKWKHWLSVRGRGPLVDECEVPKQGRKLAPRGGGLQGGGTPYFWPAGHPWEPMRPAC